MHHTYSIAHMTTHIHAFATLHVFMEIQGDMSSVEPVGSFNHHAHASICDVSAFQTLILQSHPCSTLREFLGSLETLVRGVKAGP